MTDVHLRWSLFDAPGEIALCQGEPPQKGGPVPKRLNYVVAAHEGDGPVQSGFLSLVEAYQGGRVLRDAEEMPVSGGEGMACRALKVSLPGDRTDTVVFGDGATQLRVDGRIDFDGSMGVFSEVGGEAQWAMLVGGRTLGTETHAIRREAGIWRGRVVSRESGTIVTDSDLPGDGAIDGCYLSVENDNDRDACYRVQKARREGDRTVIDVGDVDFVRGMVDELDYAKGFTYDFEVGAELRVVRTWVERW